MIQPIRNDATLIVGKFVKTTPHQLREIAQRMEEASLNGRVRPGEDALYPLADGLFLYQEGDVTDAQWQARQRVKV